MDVKNTKPNQSATEKLARVVEGRGRVLLTNVPVALSPLPMSAKAGFALLSWPGTDKRRHWCISMAD